jgi:uncharacterized protein YnzC (UPF0291/DUF896 family)
MRSWVLLALMLAACSKGPQADLPSISQARSLAAEWALVNEQNEQEKLTSDYVTTMRESFRDQLRTASKALTQADSQYGRDISALLAEPDDARPEQLRAYAERLKRQEDALESA